MTSVITTQKITKNYGKHTAVDEVSITLQKGDIYGLIGKNGAGKSTLFKLLMGLSTPNSGSMTIMGETGNHGLNISRRSIGFMIGTNFFTYLNAYDNLEYFRKIKGISDPKEVERVLKLVELDGVKKKFKAFSMGMKQRLGIANALMGNPDIVILDEPVNGLDPQGIADFRKLIQRLNHEHGITFIVSSHILTELGMMATRFGFIHNGKLIEEISNSVLRERTRSSLLVQVEDTVRVATLLEEELNTTNYRVLNDNTIMLRDFINESDKVSELITSHNIKLFQLAIVETSLEDYFLNLIGGAHNV